MDTKGKMKKSFDFLKNPITILIAIVIAIVFGILGSKGSVDVEISQRTFYDWIHIVVMFCKPFGNMYLNLLKMTVYPILIAAIISSIAGLVKSPELGRFLSRMLICFVIMLLVTALIGTFAGLIGQPGANLSDEARATLGKSIEKSQYKVDMEVSLSEAQKQKKERARFIDFFVNIVPQNVFRSLADELALQLVFFSIFFGIAISMIRGEKSDFIITLFEGLFKAFQKIINWLMYLLPFGLIFLLAGQITSSQKFFEVLGAMIWFIVLFYIVGMLTLTINTLIIWKRSQEKFGIVFKELLDPIIIALATRSSFATLPAAIKALNQRLNFYESTTKLYIPLGITLGRFGNIIYFSLAALFVSQLYAVPLTISGIFIVIIGSIFAGTATAGATGLATLGLLSIVLGPLGLPVEAVLILFMTIDTIIDPMRTLLIVHSNMAVNAMIAERATIGDRRQRIRCVYGEVSDNDYFNQIINKGEITAAVLKQDRPLFHFKDSQGNLSGADVDMAKTVAHSFNVKLAINQEAETVEDLIALLNNGKADFIVSRISSQSNMKEQVIFSDPYLSFHKALLINRDQAQGKNVKTLISSYNGKIGVVNDSSFEDSVPKLFPRAEIVRFSDYLSLVEAVADGDILAGYGNEVDFRYELKQMIDGQQKTLCAVFRNTEDDYVMAIARENQSFIYLLNKAIIEENINQAAEQFISKYEKQ